MAGLIILTSCRNNQPALYYQHHRTIDYPSASAIEYYDNRLYIMGDDATYVLVTDTAFEILDRISLFATQGDRVPKYKKHDIEAAGLQVSKGLARLYFLSSGSLATRNFLITGEPPFMVFRVDTFSHQLLRQSLAKIPELNIEGFTQIDHRLVLANRGNLAHPKNFLVVCDSGVLSENRKIQQLEWKNQPFIGISGLFYDSSNDRLWLTGSEEATGNTLEDGAIGDSHLAWINNYQQRLKDSVLRPDGEVNLSKQYPAFHGHKIESITLQTVRRNRYFLYLAADNDNGKSTLFKMALTF